MTLLGGTMQNVTVRSSLLAVLCLFAFMIVFGAAVGVFALHRASQYTFEVQQASTQAMSATAVHSALARLRSDLEFTSNEASELSGTQAAEGPFGKVRRDLQSVQARLEEFNKLFSELHSDEAVALSDKLGQLTRHLDNATSSLEKRDLYKYVDYVADFERDDLEVTKLLSNFQQNADDVGQMVTSKLRQEFTLVVWMVVFGVGGSLLTVVIVHLLLRKIVIKPLNDAVVLLDRVADGDLATPIYQHGKNEIGSLFSAMRRMQQRLSDTVSRVRQTSDGINARAHDIAQGNVDLSRRTETQAGSLQDTAASMEELTGTVRQNADHADKASQLAKNAATIAVKGGDAVEHVVETMNAISDSSRRIVDIISVIDGIAFQTNILALNASVEAARAGEQGRGFAVVASEVRSLAQRSSVAAKEIRELITTSVQKIDSGNAMVLEAGETMKEVVASIGSASTIVEQISHATREQSEGIAQVNQAIERIDGITQQNATLVQEASQAAQTLQDQAAMLVDVVSTFKLAVNDMAAIGQRPEQDITPDNLTLSHIEEKALASEPT